MANEQQLAIISPDPCNYPWAQVARASTHGQTNANPSQRYKFAPTNRRISLQQWRYRSLNVQNAWTRAATSECTKRGKRNPSSWTRRGLPECSIISYSVEPAGPNGAPGRTACRRLHSLEPKRQRLAICSDNLHRQSIHNDKEQRERNLNFRHVGWALWREIYCIAAQKSWDRHTSKKQVPHLANNLIRFSDELRSGSKPVLADTRLCAWRGRDQHPFPTLLRCEQLCKLKLQVILNRDRIRPLSAEHRFASLLRTASRRVAQAFDTAL